MIHLMGVIVVVGVPVMLVDMWIWLSVAPPGAGPSQPVAGKNACKNSFIAGKLINSLLPEAGQYRSGNQEGDYLWARETI